MHAAMCALGRIVPVGHPAAYDPLLPVDASN